MRKEISGEVTKVEPSIRLAISSDSQDLKKIDTVVPTEPSRVEMIDKWLRDEIVHVAELDGQVVGYGVFNHAFFHQGQVEMLMIHVDHRGKQIGEKILKTMEKICDTSKLYVTTNSSNHRMQRLLRRLGYRSGGYIHELDPGDPELVFVKDVDHA